MGVDASGITAMQNFGKIGQRVNKLKGDRQYIELINLRILWVSNYVYLFVESRCVTDYLGSQIPLILPSLLYSEDPLSPKSRTLFLEDPF